MICIEGLSQFCQLGSIVCWIGFITLRMKFVNLAVWLALLNQTVSCGVRFVDKFFKTAVTKLSLVETTGGLLLTEIIINDDSVYFRAHWLQPELHPGWSKGRCCLVSSVVALPDFSKCEKSSRITSDTCRYVRRARWCGAFWLTWRSVFAAAFLSPGNSERTEHRITTRRRLMETADDVADHWRCSTSTVDRPTEPRIKPTFSNGQGTTRFVAVGLAAPSGPIQQAGWSL